MMLREKIFCEIKCQQKRSNDIWMFQQYWGAFACGKLNEYERKSFTNEMKQLCEDGIFKEESYLNGTVNYRLTAYGEQIIYN